MRSALRSTASVVAGFIVASIVMTIVETINGRVLYPGLAKAAEGVTDRETIRAILPRRPRSRFSSWSPAGSWAASPAAGSPPVSRGGRIWLTASCSALLLTVGRHREQPDAAATAVVLGGGASSC